MSSTLRLSVAALLPLACWGQFSSTASKVKSGTTLPASCSIAAVYVKTAAPNAGQYYCNPANTWNQLGPAGAGTAAGGANAMQVGNGAGGFVDSGCTATGGVATCANGFVGPDVFSVVGSEKAKGAAPAAGKLECFFESTDHTLECQNSAGTIVGKLYLVGTTAGTVAAGNDSRFTGISYTIASGTATLATGSIAANSCASAVTVTATGTATTDVISWTPNASLIAVTGYTPGGTLKIFPYPTANNVNFVVCNAHATDAVTPGAVTLNWRVAR